MLTDRLNLKTVTLAAVLAFSLFGAAGCGAQTSTDDSTGQAETSETTSEATSSETNAQGFSPEYMQAFGVTGIMNSFADEDIYEGTITSPEDAQAVVEGLVTKIGGDETTKLELMFVRPTEDHTYYIFRQKAGDVFVHGATVKLVTDKDGKATGLISSIMPAIQLEDLDNWAVSQEDAEKVVLEACASEGAPDAEIISGATEQTIIPIQNGAEQYRYVWVVYTKNFYEGSHAAYLAHYVGEDGTYLYNLGVAEPGNADSLSGSAAAFAFDNFEQSTWTGTVTTHDGATKEITVPTLTDAETGDIILGDAKRKILCADYAEFNFKETISPRVAADGKFDDKELLVYDCFVRVWDFYDSIGWTGPDDEGTPSLLLMDMVTEKGDPIQNACYAGKSWGFQTFAFNRIDFDGECTDVIAHEFTHCVTSTTMTTNLYVNDLGAINEGMSDILGNLVEMLIEDQPEGAWIIGENEGGENPYRSMSDPHKYAQPEFAWDAYYGPAVVEPSPANDNGGVHINSSMLNIISYKLDQAGMDPSDQFYFWMNVALAMSPLTDYPQMVYLLPWCMEQAGYPQYVDALNKAIEEAKYNTTELSSTLPENTGVITIQLPDEALSLAGSMRLTVVDEDTELTCVSWPEGETGKMTVVLPAGNYALGLELFDGDGPIETKLYGESGWKTRESELDFSETATVKAGETVELTSVGLDQWSAATESAADAA